MRDGLTGLASKPEETGLTGLASKPGETGLTGLSIKTGGGFGEVKVEAEGTLRHREACVKTKRNREGGVSVRCFYKKMDQFVPAWACTLIYSVGIFLSFERDLEDKKKGISSHPMTTCSLFSLFFGHPLLSSVFLSPLLFST